MSHLAPFSYIDRLVTMFLVFAWAIHYLSKSRRWSKINIFNPSCGNVRSTVCLLLLAQMIVFLIYDAIVNIHIKSIQSSDTLLTVSGTMINLGFTFKSSAHFLTLAFWASVAKETFSCGSFGTSKEFLIYKIYSVVSFTLYPFAQFCFSSKLLSIVLPQVVYHCESLAVIVLTALINRRLHNIVSSSKLSMHLQNRLEFYRLANNAQMFLVAVDMLSLGLINIDILSGVKMIAESEIATDFPTKFFSISYCLTSLPMLMNIFPPLHVLEFATTTNGKTNASSRRAAVLTSGERSHPDSFPDKRAYQSQPQIYDSLKKGDPQGQGRLVSSLVDLSSYSANHNASQ